MPCVLRWFAVLVVGGFVPALLSAEDVSSKRQLAELGQRLDALRKSKTHTADLLADAEVFHKGLVWALRYDSKFTPADVTLLQKSLARCNERLAALEAGKPAWPTRKGRLVRGFVSKVDGSVQPYGLVVPSSCDPAKPIRLDVVLHGSSKPVGMSELKFMGRFDEAASAPAADFIELHPLGRVENGYRWAGETDVFEAIDAVCRQYSIDRNRIVLRGMSMGASGTWHLGLKHPDRFVALGPYCGYVDTHKFSETPLANFIKVGPLPQQQEKMLHMLDSLDYAANAGMVPAVACMGDKDVFFQAHELMAAAMAKEGLTMVNLIAPGKGHVQDPVTHAEQMRRIKEHADKGRNTLPKHVRFVTWTLKYNRCDWQQILGLGEHYARTELEATISDDGIVDVKEPRNVTRFAVQPPVRRNNKWQLRIAGVNVLLPADSLAPVIAKRDGNWVYLGELGKVSLDGKRPGVQGPIDDAFTSPFLCVRGTGKAWNPAVQAWADAKLNQFAAEWHHYLRGELPVKDDTAVTDEEMKKYNLILFGDPGSNRLLARALPKLPVTWTEKEVRFGKDSFSAAEHAPVFIQPSPFAENRYVVVNSGHTFGEKELASLNYLLFPRLGDWAILNVSKPAPENVIRTGFFDEQWK